MVVVRGRGKGREHWEEKGRYIGMTAAYTIACRGVEGALKRKEPLAAGLPRPTQEGELAAVALVLRE